MRSLRFVSGGIAPKDAGGNAQGAGNGIDAPRRNAPALAPLGNRGWGNAAGVCHQTDAAAALEDVGVESGVGDSVRHAHCLSLISMARQEMVPKKSGFSERLRAARTRAGLTQREVAALLGVSAAAVAHWENGQRGGEQLPMSRHINDLARILSVSIAYLSGTEGADRGAQNDTEAELLIMFRQLGPDQRHAFVAMLRSMGGCPT